MVHKDRYLGQSSQVHFISELARAFLVILSVLDGTAEVGAKVRKGSKKVGDLKIAKCSFHQASAPRGWSG